MPENSSLSICNANARVRHEYGSWSHNLLSMQLSEASSLFRRPRPSRTFVHVFLQQPLAEWTSFPDRGPIIQQCKGDRDARDAGKPKYRRCPRDSKFCIERIRSEGEQCARDAPHDHRGCKCTGGVDFVCIGDVCEKRDEGCLVCESENQARQHGDDPVDT